MDGAEDAQQVLADVHLGALIRMEMHRSLEADTGLPIAQFFQHHLDQALDGIEIGLGLKFLPSVLLQIAAQHEREALLGAVLGIDAADLEERHVLHAARQIISGALQQAGQDGRPYDLAFLAHRRGQRHMAGQRHDGIRQFLFPDQRICFCLIQSLSGKQLAQAAAQLLTRGQRTDRGRHHRHRAGQIVKPDHADDLLGDVRLHGNILAV